MKKFLYMFMAMMASTLIFACSDDKEEPMVPVTISLELPEGVSTSDITEARYTLRDINSSETFSFTDASAIEVRAGLYDVTYTADYTLANGVTSTLRGTKQSVQVATPSTAVSLTVYANIENDDFVIAEIFYTGTQQPTGGQYMGDQYIKLYNNTDHVLYADGITLFESKFLTTSKYEYTPDIMNEAVAVMALYTVPGNGSEHPVQPGEYFLIANNGMDHKSICPNSFDLSGADYEWYDESSNPNFQDIDSPVPNMDKWYATTLTTYSFHNRGFTAIGIARMGTSKDTWLSDYVYDYNYNMVLPAGTFPMSGSAYKVPNNWIVDVVNLGVEAVYEWNVTSPALDMGWTYCGQVDQDKTRYFHSVRRKVLYLKADGTPVLQDTNNSTSDFNPYVIPSLIEEQQSAIDVNGTKCTQRTYDGVMKMN